MLSSLAWAYIRSVVLLSECPSRAATLTTSAPLVMARLADVWRSLCGWKCSMSKDVQTEMLDRLKGAEVEV